MIRKGLKLNNLIYLINFEDNYFEDELKDIFIDLVRENKNIIKFNLNGTKFENKDEITQFIHQNRKRCKIARNGYLQLLSILSTI